MNHANAGSSVLLGDLTWHGFAEPNLMGRFQVSSEAIPWE